MACCEAPATGGALYCSNDARLKFNVSLYQHFVNSAPTSSALTQANQTTSSYKAGIQAYMCQAGITDPAVFELERLEAFAYFQRQFNLPVTATIVPIDGSGQGPDSNNVIAYFGTPMWKVVIIENDREQIIGFYRPTVTCRGVQVLCQAGLDKADYTGAAILLHELYFVPRLLGGQVQVQDIPAPQPFPPGEQRGNPQSTQLLGFGSTANTLLRTPLEVYGKILLYPSCGKRPAEIKIRSEFGVSPTFSVNDLHVLNPDGLTYNIENGDFGGTRLSAASRDLSNGQWIGTVAWSFNSTLTSSYLAATDTLATPYTLDLVKSFVVDFPTSLARCAEIFPCGPASDPCGCEGKRRKRADSNACMACDERRF